MKGLCVSNRPCQGSGRNECCAFLTWQDGRGGTAPRFILFRRSVSASDSPCRPPALQHRQASQERVNLHPSSAILPFRFYFSFLSPLLLSLLTVTTSKFLFGETVCYHGSRGALVDEGPEVLHDHKCVVLAQPCNCI
jgi:hypothetical protein